MYRYVQYVLVIEQLVDTFGETGGIGSKLQSLLEKRAAEKDNWVSICYTQIYPIVYFTIT